MKTDRSIEQLIESFYQGILKKRENQIKCLIFDKLSMKERGLFLVESE